MSEQTAKLAGWAPQGKPAEDADIQFHRQLLVEIVFGLFNTKKEILSRMGMPPQPISLFEIYMEYRSRMAQLRSIKKSWFKQWRWKQHNKRWIDRRVNEIACPKYYEDGIPKVVATTAGLYEPNPQLFEGKAKP